MDTTTQATVSLKVNPLIEKLAKDLNGDSVVKLRGFIGPTEANRIRLYTDLSLTRYIELPTTGVLHVDTPESPESATTIFVRSSTQVTSVRLSRTRVQASEVHRQRSRRLGNSGSGSAMFLAREPVGFLGVCGEFLEGARAAFDAAMEAWDNGDAESADAHFVEALDLMNTAIRAGCNPWAVN